MTGISVPRTPAHLGTGRQFIYPVRNLPARISLRHSPKERAATYAYVDVVSNGVYPSETL